MTDFHTLDEAFAEFERRADLVSAGREASTSPVRQAPSLRRPMLVAASVAAVVAVSGGAVLLAQHHSGPSHSLAGGAAPTSVIGSADPAPSSSPSAVASTAPPSASPTAQPASGASFPPKNPTQLRTRFEAVLEGIATVTVDTTADEPGDPYIEGVLTTAGGAKGGYDIQILRDDPGAKAQCTQDPGPCDLSSLADGATLAVKTVSQSSSTTLYEMQLVRADGTLFIFDLSNQTDPKGAGPVLGERPPLTVAQMTTILQSDRW